MKKKSMVSALAVMLIVLVLCGCAGGGSSEDVGDKRDKNKKESTGNVSGIFDGGNADDGMKQDDTKHSWGGFGGSENDTSQSEMQGQGSTSAQGGASDGSHYGNLDVTSSPEYDFMYQIENGEAIITSYTGTDGTVVVPAMIGGAPVRSIRGFSSWGKDDNVRDIILPDTVRSIEKLAFCNFKSLESIYIPDGVTEIGVSAFTGCGNLKEIVLPDSVTTVGKSAFAGCGSITGAVLPSGLTQIPEMLFMNCEKLVNVTLPATVTQIDGWAFVDCKSLENIVIPVGVTYIGDVAFSGCISLGGVALPDTVRDIGDSVFGDCDNIVVTYDGKDYGPGKMVDLEIAIRKPSDDIEGHYVNTDDSGEYLGEYAEMDISKSADGSYQIGLADYMSYGGVAAGKSLFGEVISIFQFDGMGDSWQSALVTLSKSGTTITMTFLDENSPTHEVIGYTTFRKIKDKK